MSWAAGSSKAGWGGARCRGQQEGLRRHLANCQMPRGLGPASAPSWTSPLTRNFTYLLIHSSFPPVSIPRGRTEAQPCARCGGAAMTQSPPHLSRSHGGQECRQRPHNVICRMERPPCWRASQTSLGRAPLAGRGHVACTGSGGHPDGVGAAARVAQDHSLSSGWSRPRPAGSGGTGPSGGSCQPQGPGLMCPVCLVTCLLERQAGPKEEMRISQGPLQHLPQFPQLT